MYQIRSHSCRAANICSGPLQVSVMTGRTGFEFLSYNWILDPFWWLTQPEYSAARQVLKYKLMKKLILEIFWVPHPKKNWASPRIFSVISKILHYEKFLGTPRKFKNSGIFTQKMNIGHKTWKKRMPVITYESKGISFEKMKSGITNENKGISF